MRAILRRGSQRANGLDYAGGDGGCGLSDPAEATASSARRKGTGNSRPRRLARRKIPLAPLGLKQYFARCGPVSKTADNEHTVASLGYAEVLSVQHSVGPPIPALPQRPDDGTHSSPVGCHAPAPAGSAFGEVGDAGGKDPVLDSVAVVGDPFSASNRLPCS